MFNMVEYNILNEITPSTRNQANKYQTSLAHTVNPKQAHIYVYILNHLKERERKKTTTHDCL